MRPILPPVLLAALAIALGGCGGGDGGGTEAEKLTVYVSAPLSGERAREGRAIANGARLALADARGRAGDFAVEAVYLDDAEGGRWSLARTAANARRAAEDASAIGYIGDLDSGATRVSLPITNQAEMVQVSPGSTAVDLTRLPPAGNLEPERLRPSDRRTFARVVPADDVQGRAAALWASRMGARTVDFVSDGSQFGDVLAASFSREAARLGLGAGEGTGVDVVYYAGEPAELFRAAEGLPRAVIGSDALLAAESSPGAGRLGGRLHATSPYIDPSRLPPRGAGFRRDYRRRFGEPAPAAAAYGYESMALLLDAIRRAGSDGESRDAVIDEVLSTTSRRSVIGTYTIDGNGDTTLDAISGYRLQGGRPAFETELRP